MKNSKFIAIAVLLGMSSTASIAGDWRVGVDFGFGFGKSAQRTNSDNTLFSKCKNRNTGGLLVVLGRVSYNNVEVHAGKWMHDTDNASCQRGSNVVGLGYVINNDGRGIRNDNSYNVSWTPGVAYTWGKEKTFGGQDGETTNWRLHSNWQVFNRLAVGLGTDDVDTEIAIHRYGSFESNHGENFVTLGIFGKKLEDNTRTPTTTKVLTKKQKQQKQHKKHDAFHNKKKNHKHVKHNKNHHHQNVHKKKKHDIKSHH